MTLRERLIEWTDIDVAEYHVAIVIGIIIEKENMQSFRDYKWMTNSHNPYATSLIRIMDGMVDHGMLIWNDQDMQVKWNPEYVLP